MLYAVHADHLGTPRLLTAANDPDMTPRWRWEGVPFGTTAANEDPDGDGTKLVFDLRFAGQYYDSETGLHYNYYRYYDPSTGRYITSDPIGLQGGLNTYGYVGGNPVNATDPLGLVQDSVTRTCLRNPALCKELHDAIRVPPPIPVPPVQNSTGDDNVIPFPGTKPKEKDKDYCPPKENKQDWCQKEKERLENNIRIGGSIIASVKNPLQRQKQYLIWAREMNISINIHNASCPNHRVEPLPL